MKIVIDIPEKRYRIIQIGEKHGVSGVLERAVLKGTPLPEGHGRLIDADKLKHAFIKWSRAVQGSFTDSDIASIVYNSPTIIEADNEMIEAYCQHDEKAVSDFIERMVEE